MYCTHINSGQCNNHISYWYINTKTFVWIVWYEKLNRLLTCSYTYGQSSWTLKLKNVTNSYFPNYSFIKRLYKHLQNKKKTGWPEGCTTKESLTYSNWTLGCQWNSGLTNSDCLCWPSGLVLANGSKTWLTEQDYLTESIESGGNSK